MELEHQLLQSKLDHKTMVSVSSLHVYTSMVLNRIISIHPKTIQLEHMKAKFERDQQQMKRESEAQLDQQKKRLQNLSDARLTKLKEESENQKEILQMRLNEMQRSLQNTLNAQQAQIQQLNTVINTRKGMWGQSIWVSTSVHNNVNGK